MENIHEIIAKDASDRLELIAEDTKQEVLPWIRDLTKKQVEQLLSTYDVLVNENKDERNTPD